MSVVGNAANVAAGNAGGATGGATNAAAPGAGGGVTNVANANAAATATTPNSMVAAGDAEEAQRKELRQLIAAIKTKNSNQQLHGLTQLKILSSADGALSASGGRRCGVAPLRAEFCRVCFTRCPVGPLALALALSLPFSRSSQQGHHPRRGHDRTHRAAARLRERQDTARRRAALAFAVGQWCG